MSSLGQSFLSRAIVPVLIFCFKVQNFWQSCTCGFGIHSSSIREFKLYEELQHGWRYLFYSAMSSLIAEIASRTNKLMLDEFHALPLHFTENDNSWMNKMVISLNERN